MNLTLPIKKKWFDMICSGEKTEEYREVKDYYIRRLCEVFITSIINAELSDPSNRVVYKDIEIVTLTNGYGKKVPRATFECPGISIGKGKTEWGAVEGEYYFVIKLGKQIK